MRTIWIVLAGAAVLGGCSGAAVARLMPKPAIVPGANLPGGPGVNRRQMYDERVGRYYYFDSKLGRYYWENGEPRFGDAPSKGAAGAGR
jgi:hypothetical protein